jgi:tripartite ATP-independent transporter DctM subunit
VLTLLFVVMLILMLLGMDIAFSMGMAGLVYLVVTALGPFPIPLAVLPQKLVNGVDSFPLLAVPLFMLAGELMNRGGITRRLVRFATSMVGHVRGGLAQVVVVVNMIMAGMSGSAIADAAATGAVLIPSMVRTGYRARFAAAAAVGAASSCGPIIPPSIPFVIIGAIAEVSVGRLFLGGAIPGLFMGFSMMGLVYAIARREDFPREPRESWRRLAVSARDAFLALLMPIIVIGGILTGATTPTEAAVVAVWYAFMLGAGVYRELKLKDIPGVLVDMGTSSGAVMITVAAATVFGWLATAERMGPRLIEAMTAVSANPLVLLLLVNVILLIMGCLMEPIPIMVLLAPILFPVMTKLGVDPVHFGVVFTLNITIGMLTPPVGLTLFLMSAIAKVPVMAIARSCAPFIVLLMGVLLVITYVPGLVLWLPNLVMGR